MGRPRLTDIAWQHCSVVDENRSHVRCNYCGHTMWGGVSRLKEHLAQKKGDVIACSMCPQAVTNQMREHLIELSHERERKARTRREALENMKKTPVQVHQPQQGGYKEEIDSEERSLLEQAIQESLRTHEMEKRRALDDDDGFEAARRESILSYQLEQRRRGEGCSYSKAGPSYLNDVVSDPETDYDSDLSF